MTIANDARVKFELVPAFHFTLIENLPDILSEGCLLAKSFVGSRLKGDLSDPDIQDARKNRLVAGTEKSLHEFVPLYFAFKPPMLARRRDRNEDIIQLRFPLDILNIDGAMFTDGNASSAETEFFRFSSVDDLKALDVATINNQVQWMKDPEKKRRKQAEILIPHHLDLDHLLDISCFSNSSRQRVESVLQGSGMTASVWVRPWHYFNESKP